MSPCIKVCGLTREEDALLAASLGARYLGLIFAAESPRRLTLDRAVEIASAVRGPLGPKAPGFVGVFVDEEEAFIAQCVERLALAAIQIHAERPLEALRLLPCRVIPAIRVRGSEDSSRIERELARGPVLLDTFVPGQHGGTGKVFDHALALPHLAHGEVWIAGGLNPDNIAGIVRRFAESGQQPAVYDVSSGVEASPGIKDHEMLRAFFAGASG